MWIRQLRIVGTRCFDDTGYVELSKKCNIFVGQNNVGKSTLLKGVLGFQMTPFESHDVRSPNGPSYVEARLNDVSADRYIAHAPSNRPATVQAVRYIRGPVPQPPPGYLQCSYTLQNPTLFGSTRPHHSVVPFLAKRKASSFDENVAEGMQAQLMGTLHNLYSRIDLLATAGHPRHAAFQSALAEIVGLPITTKASQSGKRAGYYLDDDKFITLDCMGDGVAEMVALIVELCLETGKIFILEEPETNLHPRGLKALLGMVRDVSEHNQFVIATHSNIVVRELGADDSTRVFRVYRDGDDPKTASSVELVPRDPVAHTALLRELGYEFSDVGLYEAWFFLEESSAERVINEILVPWFVPELKGRLRTYSAAGISNVEPGVAEFQRLVVFVHLQPAYEGRLWIRVDSGGGGEQVAQSLRDKFSYLTEETCSAFSKTEFERYYPSQFQERVGEVFAIASKPERQRRKIELLIDVLEWSRGNLIDAKLAWSQSAAEPIDVLMKIKDSLG